MADIENGRCHAKKAPEKGPPLFDHGRIIIQAHDVGWLVTGIFTIFAVLISFWLMSKHLRWYTNKSEQRHIVRILLMPPIYAAVSMASYLFWNHSTPLLLLRDCYESTVLTAFFYLLLMYVSPDLEEQKEVFRKLGLSKENDKARQRRGEPSTKWIFPLGPVRWKPHDGLYFLQLMKWGVLQYCVIRPTTTLAAVTLDYMGLYCEDSWSPGWGHIYITIIISISVSIAMYCLLQLYFPVSELLKPQKPLLKLFAVKAVVFLTFWQATGLSLLTTFEIVKDTPYMTAENINIGIGAILECVEMMIFAILHIKAFSYKPYVTGTPTPRWRALIHAFNFKETLSELWDGTVYMFHRMRGREVDVMARRQAALEGIFGQSRIQIQGKRPQKPASEKNDSLDVRVEIEETMYVGDDRQWLGVGDDHTYSLGRQFRRTREKSEGLEEGIERELEKRGISRRQPSDSRAVYNLLDPTAKLESGANRRRERSWWRQMYSRLSQHEPPEPSLPPNEPLVSSEVAAAESRRRQRSRHPTPSEIRAHAYDDPPPPSAIRTYKASKSSRKAPEPTLPNVSLPELTLPVHKPQTPPLLSTSFPSPPRSPPANVMSLQHYPISCLPAAANPASNRLSANSASGNRLSLPETPNSSDSFFARAFPPLSEASLSSEALHSMVSSQSHQSQVRLPGSATVIESGFVASRMPRVLEPGVTAPPLRPVSEEGQVGEAPMPAVAARRTDGGGRRSGPSYRVPVPPLPPPSNAVPSTSRRAEAPKSSGQQPLVRPRLTRDQVVLPAPLAPPLARVDHDGPQRPYPFPSEAPPTISPPPTRSSHSRSAAHVDPNSGRRSDRPAFQAEPTTPASLRRSKHRNGRRYSQGVAPDPYAPESARPSRRMSLPVPQEPIYESRAGYGGKS